MNFAFTIFYYFPFGGLQLDFKRILEETLRRGHSVTVLYDRWEGEFIRGASYCHLPVKAWTNWGKALNFERKAAAYLASHSFDGVIGFNRMSGLDVYFAADNCFASRSRKKNAFVRLIAPRYRVLERMEASIFAAGAKTQILTLTKDQENAFRHEYGTEPERFHRMPPGVGKEFYLRTREEQLELRKKTRQGIAENTLILIQVCSSFRTKGLDRVLYAIDSLPYELRKRVLFWAVGKEKPGKYKVLAEKLGIDKQVIFTGARPDIAELLHGADLMVHPARNEATGGVLAEALSCGLPVIASGCCGYASYVKESGGIVLHEPFDQDELNRELASLLSSAEALSALKQKTCSYAVTADFHKRCSLAVDTIEESCCHA